MPQTLPANYPELDRIVQRLARIVAFMINAEVRDVESEAIYKAQYVLEGLIQALQERV